MSRVVPTTPLQGLSPCFPTGLIRLLLSPLAPLESSVTPSSGVPTRRFWPAPRPLLFCLFPPCSRGFFSLQGNPGRFECFPLPQRLSNPSFPFLGHLKKQFPNGLSCLRTTRSHDRQPVFLGRLQAIQVSFLWFSSPGFEVWFCSCRNRLFVSQQFSRRCKKYAPSRQDSALRPPAERLETPASIT